MIFKITTLAATAVLAKNWDEMNTGSDTLKATATGAIEDLSGEIRDEQSDNSHVEAELDSEKKTVGGLREELQEAQNKNAELKAQEEALMQRIADLTAEGENLDSEFASTKASSETEIKNLEDQVAGLEAQLENLVTEHGGIISEKEAAIENTYEELEEANNTVMVQDSTIEALLDEIRIAEKDLIEAESCNKNADDRVSKANFEFEEMNTDFAIDESARNGEITRLGQDIGSVEGTIGEQEETISGLRSEIDAMMARSQNLPIEISYPVQDIFNEYTAVVTTADGLMRRLISAMAF